MRIVRILLVTGLLMLAGGCATTAAFMMRRDGNADVLYPATLIDVNVACGSVLRRAPSGPSLDIFSGNLLFFPLAIVDLPVSLFSDTLMLPFDVYRIFISPEGRLPFVLVVRDDEGEPVSDAAIKGYGGGAIAGRTREDGSCVLWRGIRRQGHYNVTKTGYYSSNGSVQYNNDDIAAMAAIARTPPKTMFINVTLRRIKNPIPMHASYKEILIPFKGTNVAYDLEQGDWVAPHGKGKYSDLIVNCDDQFSDPWTGFRKLELTFGTNALDGVCRYKFDNFSIFRTIYEAPEHGYEKGLTWSLNLTKDKMDVNEPPPDEYFVFRVRTELDDKGEIVKANYGKIYGPVQYGNLGGRLILKMIYYFNPEVNSRNLEFDPKKNLSQQDVSLP